MNEIVKILEELFDLGDCETEMEKIEMALGIFEENHANFKGEYKSLEYELIVKLLEKIKTEETLKLNKEMLNTIVDRTIDSTKKKYHLNGIKKSRIEQKLERMKNE